MGKTLSEKQVNEKRKPDWSRCLPRPLVIPNVMTLATLADVRESMRHLAEDRRQLSQQFWQVAQSPWSGN